MGTRAAFWIGNPVDLGTREWLGCVAWDGYPSEFAQLAEITTAPEFRAAIDATATIRSDFADPTKGGWPFPWNDDIFLTDYTYALIDGIVQCACFHSEFRPLAFELANPESESPPDDPTHHNVPALADYDRSQPDSIMIFHI